MNERHLGIKSKFAGSGLLGDQEGRWSMGALGAALQCARATCREPFHLLSNRYESTARACSNIPSIYRVVRNCVPEWRLQLYSSSALGQKHRSVLRGGCEHDSYVCLQHRGMGKKPLLLISTAGCILPHSSRADGWAHWAGIAARAAPSQHTGIPGCPQMLGINSSSPTCPSSWGQKQMEEQP